MTMSMDLGAVAAVAEASGRAGRRGSSGAAVDGEVARLRRVGLRPTRQRVELARMLFGAGDRHVSAEAVYDEAMARGVRVSLATVYNTLKQFTEAGLLRELAVSGAKSWFDTRVDEHHHFYVEGEGAMADVEADQVALACLPPPPPGMAIVGWDVVIRLRRIATS